MLFTIVSASPAVVFAQAVPPFIGGPVTAFDIQVSVVG